MITKNFKITIEYDGTNYCGWQIQKSESTIQGVIKRTLEDIVKIDNINIVGSGRTDSGVHALGQVFNVKIETKMNPNQIMKAMNSNLPKDIRVVFSDIVDDGFNARFSALDREYVYKVTKERSAFDYKYYWNYPYDYDISILKECADIVLKQENFYNFCRPSPDIKNYNCTINCSDWDIVDNILNYKINANRFLHHMVRMLVGTMLDVSRGNISKNVFLRLFDEDASKNKVLTAPPRGLYLLKVKY